MEYSKFEVSIDASTEKVWDSLWSDANYPKWTNAFCEGSHAVTNWQEGSKVHFLDGNNSGMFAVIERNEREKFMSIKALGEVVNGNEIVDTEMAKACAGSYENYTLTREGDKTHLLIELIADTLPPEFKDFMDNAWPKALKALKAVAESN
ncbi:SRPBCC domain-containing protein [Mucilaginibacter litoreus]|uniref:SRPBCC domain-containing protein n=1 Tax=Mucilaginibacter litoreus TaxID=1048221 RepID=A0ABW3AQQ5_9SPHI